MGGAGEVLRGDAERAIERDVAGVRAAGSPACQDLADLGALYARFVDVVRSGGTLGPDVSMLKLFQTELYQRISDEMLAIAGENAGLLDPMEGNRELHPAGLFLQARPTTIYGGSNEIQRNIIAKNVLELPG